MEVTVNGEPKQVEPNATVADLLALLGLNPKYLAVERNLQLVPRGEHAACELREGDRLEIVTLVGGG